MIVTLLLVFGLLIGAASTSALPVDIERVEIDDIEIDAGQTNRLSLERDQEVEVEVRITSPVDLDDVELEAFFSGYEYNDVEPLGSRTTVFDMDAGVTYVKRLPIRISGDVEEDDYQLRILITDRYDPAPVLENYAIKLDVPRHRLDIEDVFFAPSRVVQAGTALLTTVRLENNGEKDQDDVRVEISIPELGVSGVDYLDEVEVEDEEETEEIFVRIPSDAKSGSYEVIVDVVYDEGHRRLVRAFPIQVEGDPRYDDLAPGQSRKAGTLITLGSTLESATAGETSAVFPITVVNQGTNSRTYTLSIESVDWADIRVTPTSTMIIEGGESKLYTVTVDAHSDAPAGAQVVNAQLKDGEKTLKELQLTVNLKSGSSSLSTLKKVLQTLLVVLLVLLVVISLVIVLKRAQGKDEDYHTETYY